MRSLAMTSWLGTMLLAVPAVAEDCAGWNSERFFASASVEEVVGCLHAGADPNEPNDTGATALHLAARLNPSAAVIRALIDAGADLSLRDKPGRAPLHLAAWKNPSAAVVEALIEAGAYPNEANDRGWTPLYLAAKANSDAVVEALVEALIKELIEASVDPGMRRRIVWTGYIPVTKAHPGGDRLAALTHGLRASAAEGSARAQYGLGVIYAEAFGGHQYGAQAAAWYRKAAAHGHAKARTRLDELIARRGYTPLHLATVRHRLVVAALRDGADPDARDNAGNTALHLAASNTDDPAVFEALVGGGADANARNDFGDTPLHLAARYNTNPVVLAVLIAAGAYPDAQGESDATPLHWAAWNNGVPAVLALVNAGANLNARRRDGATPLHWATWNDDVSVISALLDAGANPDVPDSSGDTPSYWAVRYANLSAFSAFARNGQ